MRLVYTKSLLICFFMLSLMLTHAQTVKQNLLVAPYLQNASPQEITIMWETAVGEESTVLYGKTTDLKKKETGISYDVNFSDHRIHEVTLKGLERFTTYYYRVRTGETYSDVYQFKTPPFAEDKKAFNVLAMSDMQRDHNEPEKFAEIVNEGILTYLKKEYGEDISDNLALVLIPGDLVENGTKYEQWQNEFFEPSKKLFSNVPVYPVLGNHEKNSTFYFKYFSLPKNGTPAYAEHWWYKDYGNTRIIGLNSNEGYRDSKEQYIWLKELLERTANNNEIDFVFAQLHHPHKSELWIPGETDFTGKVVELLENFTTKTGKPSIHFFGHTHGYSRGQSKEHKHLWINVASAGGAIDNWGEFEGRDYDEFTVTQDEYGFVMVEVDPNPENPKFVVKRVSRGNTVQSRNNEVTDSMVIYKKKRLPYAPIIESPMGEHIAIKDVMLKAGGYESDYKDSFHAASNWQLATDAEFSNIIVDRWKQYQNWYYNENRQKDDDLTDEKMPLLKSNTKYFWRVRYRDQNLNWSDWSKTATFTTK